MGYLEFILALVAVGAFWHVGATFASRGQGVTGEDFEALQDHVAAIEEMTKLAAAGVADHKGVLANHAEALQRHGKTLTNLGLGGDAVTAQHRRPSRPGR